jgi:hypothetical protein
MAIDRLFDLRGRFPVTRLSHVIAKITLVTTTFKRSNVGSTFDIGCVKTNYPTLRLHRCVNETQH